MNSLKEITSSHQWKFWMGVVRIVGIVLLLLILLLFIKEIEVVKFLSYDPCLYCMNKTGATCWQFKP